MLDACYQARAWEQAESYWIDIMNTTVFKILLAAIKSWVEKRMIYLRN